MTPVEGRDYPPHGTHRPPGQDVGGSGIRPWTTIPNSILFRLQLQKALGDVVGGLRVHLFRFLLVIESDCTWMVLLEMRPLPLQPAWPLRLEAAERDIARPYKWPDLEGRLYKEAFRSIETFTITEEGRHTGPPLQVFCR